MRISKALLLVGGLLALAVPALAATDDGVTIKALRAGSNAAIAQHDADAAVSIFLPDGMVLGSGGGLIQGREAMQAAFKSSFVQPDFVTYVREPLTVTVGGDTASEEGRWRGVWKNREIGGRFLARWSRTAEGWRIKSEMYVPTY